MGILKNYVIATLSLYVASLLAQGLSFDGGAQTILIAGGVLTLAFIIVRPIINLLLLPINLITFGFFRWISSAVALYLVTLVVPGFKILGFNFTGYTNNWFSLPAFSLDGILAYIAYSFVLSAVAGIIHWVIK